MIKPSFMYFISMLFLSRLIFITQIIPDRCFDSPGKGGGAWLQLFVDYVQPVW